MTSDADPLADYPVVITLPVLWGDQDALGHVNNVVPIRWFEAARVEFFRRYGLQENLRQRSEEASLSFILASVTCDYRQPLHWPDTVRVGARIGRFGRSSMHMEHVVVSERLEAPAVEGTAVVVMFDYVRGCSVPIPESWRRTIDGGPPSEGDKESG